MHVSLRSMGFVGLLAGLMTSAGLLPDPPAPRAASAVPSKTTRARLHASPQPTKPVHARAATTPCQPVTADLQLDGTAVFESGGGLALLTAAGRPRLLKPGQQVLGHQLQRIRPGKLVFEHDGQMRCLTAARRTTSTRSRATSARPAGPRRIAPGQYAVDRRWLTRRLTDRQTLKGVRARPYVKNGRLAGFAIKTVPKGHVLRTLGIRPGDVIVGANGAPLSGTGQVLELYDALPEADGLSLSIRRRGRPVELDFAITGGR